MSIHEAIKSGIISRHLFLSVALFLLLGLMAHPVRTFLSDWQFREGMDLLRNLRDSHGGELVLTEEVAPAYLDALRMIEVAKNVQPGRTEYLLALSNMNYRYGIWSEMMRVLESQLALPLLSSDEAFLHSLREVNAALARDPLDPEVHMVLGRHYQRIGDMENMRRSYDRAKFLFPANANIRYRIAREYLIARMNAEAIREATELAALDDSYRIGMSKESELHREKRSEYYLVRIQSSYLLKALEILWRASGKDKKVVLDALPESREARSAAEFYFETKGIE